MIHDVVSEALEFANNLLPTSNNPFDLSRFLDIEVITDKPMHNDGYLICEDGCKLIFVSSKISNYHRQKFIVSHELGHFFMHRNQLYCCEKITESISRINSTQQEREANSFASEYLLPQLQLSEALPNHSLHFYNISEIANRYDVSMTLAAMKAVQLSKTANEVLICYVGNRKKWFVSNNKSIYFNMIPSVCPVDLMTFPQEAYVTGAWESLFRGSVCQEIFHPIPNQSLVLLSGTTPTWE